MHLTGRVIFREVKRGEIMIIVFNFRACGYRKTGLCEDGGDFFQHAGNGMYQAF